MRKISGFTLIEVLVAVALTGMILLTGYSTFQKIMQAQSRLGAAIDVQKNLFYTNEKLAALIRDGGTIDYEEYFNRRRLKYDQSKRSDGIFTFTNYSHFGNGDNPSGRPAIYYCGVSTSITEEACLSASVVFDPTIPPYASIMTTIPVTTPPSTIGHQSYGQYAALAYNYLDPAGWPMPIKLPPIFLATDDIQIASRDIDGLVSFGNKKIIDVGLPELYLIKKNLDNTYTRTYFRHVYVQDSFPGTPTCNPTSGNMTGCLGKIQMTKLEECDEVTSAGLPASDGIIDAWIPHADFRIGSVACPTHITLNTIFKSAHEETIASGSVAPNLIWVDVTAPDMNVIRATFLPSPLKIPEFMSGAGDPTQSPSVSIYLEVELSTKLRNKSFVRQNMNYPRTLITTYDLSE